MAAGCLGSWLRWQLVALAAGCHGSWLPWQLVDVNPWQLVASKF